MRQVEIPRGGDFGELSEAPTRGVAELRPWLDDHEDAKKSVIAVAEETGNTAKAKTQFFSLSSFFNLCCLNLSAFPGGRNHTSH